jgi:hypothetical protein
LGDLHPTVSSDRRKRSLISTNGGVRPRWRPDGNELFYIAVDDRLMAVPIHKDPQRHTVEAGAPVNLFTTRIGGALQQGLVGVGQYVVAPDGQRFLMSSVADEVTASPITIIMNWKPSDKCAIESPITPVSARILHGLAAGALAASYMVNGVTFVAEKALLWIPKLGGTQ